MAPAFDFTTVSFVLATCFPPDDISLSTPYFFLGKLTLSLRTLWSLEPPPQACEDPGPGFGTPRACAPP